MAEALYGPEGYYTRRPRLGGADADFFTSPELHPAFGALLGQFAARVWHALGRPPRFDVVEHGPGTGALCRDLLEWADHVAPDFGAAVSYRLVETSPALRAVQRRTLEAAGLLTDRVAWDESTSGPHSLMAGSPHPQPLSLCAGEGSQTIGLPLSHGRERGPGGEGSLGLRGEGSWPSVGGAHSVFGLILANELVDALPVHLVALRQGQLRERYVVLAGDDLGWQEDEPSTPALAAYFDRLGVWPGEDCLAEVNLAGVHWLERTAGTLSRGALLLLDYGYPAPELYAPERRQGTLLTYRAHSLGSDPLRHVGEQDITAHVDFTSLARAGERGGLDTVGLISQASLLRRLGIGDYLQRLDRSAASAWSHEANRRALLELVEPTGLGRVQALLQTRGLPGFDPFADEPLGPATSAGGRLDEDWLPLLRPGQMRLPGPLEAEGFFDLEGQWQELFPPDLEGAGDPSPEAAPLPRDSG